MKEIVISSSDKLFKTILELLLPVFMGKVIGVGEVTNEEKNY